MEFRLSTSLFRVVNELRSCEQQSLIKQHAPCGERGKWCRKLAFSGACGSDKGQAPEVACSALGSPDPHCLHPPSVELLYPSPIACLCNSPGRYFELLQKSRKKTFQIRKVK
jgi:hypothetical protein